MSENKNNISRRGFLKAMGAGATVAAGAALESCANRKNAEFDPAGHHTTEVPVGQMTYRTNPKQGDKVSLLGYGCMRWPTLPQPDANGNIIDQEQVNTLVDYAIEHGVNYFDTAPVYVQGQSERATAEALKKYPRDSYFLATKLSSHRFSGQGLPTEEMYKRSMDMYRNSFINLQTDYIDYYLLHGVGFGGGMPSVAERFFDTGILDFLVKEKEAGKIRNLGFSFHGDVAVFDYMLQLHDEGRYHWDFVQIQMNYQDWIVGMGASVPASRLYESLAQRNIPVVIMEPLLGGRLSNLPNHIVARLKERNPENSVASWAFRFCGSQPAVLSCLSGMTYMEHLQDNIRSFAPLVELTDEEKQFLYDTAELIHQYPTIQCNSCNYCMPCPYGLDIPSVFVHYNKCVNEGNIAESRTDENYKKARQAFLVGYDRSVPKLRQASHCTGCRQCVPECPQRINIPAEMQRIDKYVESLKQNTL
ncbi:MAG: aldo/keto reductase [Bacteroidaceae bacterium]|nr:aldo/keto reductase [Bacteroidaceae bacterium]